MCVASTKGFFTEARGKIHQTRTYFSVLKQDVAFKKLVSVFFLQAEIILDYVYTILKIFVLVLNILDLIFKVDIHSIVALKFHKELFGK